MTGVQTCALPISVILEENGLTVRGYGSDTDIIVAAAKAYINALNKLEGLKKKPAKGI